MSINLWWTGNEKKRIENLSELKEPIYDIEKPLFIMENEAGLYYSTEGSFSSLKTDHAVKLAAFAEPVPMQNLGDKEFCNNYDIKYPYIGGSMAYGISSVELVATLAEHKMLAFLGTGGLTIEQAEEDILKLKQRLKDLPFGCNLIHIPSSAQEEMNFVNLYLKHNVNIIEASAYINLTPALIKFRVKGLKKLPDGQIEETNKIIAKASRTEVAERFMSPPPKEILTELLSKGEITDEEVLLSENLPVAWDITAEADSGGHTDNRPAFALFPAFTALRDKLQTKYAKKIRIGFGGGLGTPLSAASAFAMGASYIVVGSIHQACTEAGTSEEARKMLALATQADTAMAPSADLFDIGGKVQVLKTGTMFPVCSFVV